MTLVAQEPAPVMVTIQAKAIHAGRVSPLLFGNFIELLDDVVPGMWAEMLNDRSFEGVEPTSKGVYFDGSPDFCDRQWDTNGTWSYDRDRPFNGARCAKLSATSGAPATLTQSGLAVKRGMTYHFSGYFRGDGAPLQASVALRTLLPDGSWMTLASATLPRFSESWRKYSVSMTARGETDRVVLELTVQGQGEVWADKLSLMPDDNVQGWRRDVVDAVKEMNPPIIRWGGSSVDPGGYLWKNGIGDRDARTPFRNRIWGRIDSNDVGIDEFCRFCEAVGAEPLICLSLADGAQSAGDLVQYCKGDMTSEWGAKRAANGHPAPYRVRYWQVGNEIAGAKPEYLGHIVEFIRAIKKADPAAQVMSSYPDQELLDLAGKDLALVCPHQYTRDLQRCDSDLRRISQMIEATPGCGNLKIGITEWNVSGGEWGLMRGRQMTLETALLNARHLHAMMRHCDKVEIGIRSNMANSFCGATFETNPSGLLRRPSFYVMQLYRRRAQPIPLQVESEKNGPDVFAGGSEDGKSFTLFAVNSESRPTPIRIIGEGSVGALRITRAETVHDTRDALQPDVMNHWSAPDRVKTTALKTNGNGVTLPPFSISAIEGTLAE
jgi:alpha-N-arabinofuranosidase